MADMDAKGRRITVTRSGEKNAAARLTEGQVRDILRRYQKGEKVRDLAREYGMGKSAMWYIVGRQTWRHLEL